MDVETIKSSAATLRSIIDACNGREATKSQASDAITAAWRAADALEEGGEKQLAYIVKGAPPTEALKALDDWLQKPVGSAPVPIVDDGGTGGSSKSLAELFTNSVTFKNYDQGLRSAPTSIVQVSSKALLDSTGYVPQALRTGRTQLPAERQVRLIDVISQGSTREASIVYMEETTTTSAAAGVAEGDDKPESTLVYTEKTSPIVKVATVLPVTDELLQDVPAMQAFLSARLSKLLMLEVERQVLSGTGAPELTGFLVAAIQSYDATGDFTVDAIGTAMDKVRVTGETDTTAIVMHPTQWGGIRNATTTDGMYVMGAPTQTLEPRLWGIPVIVTSAIADGTALVGDFQSCAQFFTRTDVQFSMSDSHSDFFVKNKTMLRVEARVALPIYRPSGFCKITGLVA